MLSLYLNKPGQKNAVSKIKGKGKQPNAAGEMWPMVDSSNQTSRKKGKNPVGKNPNP